MQPSVSLLQHAPLALLARMLARTAPKGSRTRKPEPEWNRAEVAEYLESAGFQQYVDCCFKAVNGAMLSKG